MEICIIRATFNIFNLSSLSRYSIAITVNYRNFINDVVSQLLEVQNVTNKGGIVMYTDLISLSLMIIWLLFIWFTKFGLKMTDKLGKYGFLSSTIVPFILLSIGQGRNAIYSGVIVIVIGSLIINKFQHRNQESNQSSQE